jgi:hypothetical protein
MYFHALQGTRKSPMRQHENQARKSGGRAFSQFLYSGAKVSGAGSAGDLVAGFPSWYRPPAEIGFRAASVRERILQYLRKCPGSRCWLASRAACTVRHCRERSQGSHARTVDVAESATETVKTKAPSFDQRVADIRAGGGEEWAETEGIGGRSQCPPARDFPLGDKRCAKAAQYGDRGPVTRKGDRSIVQIPRRANG